MKRAMKIKRISATSPCYSLFDPRLLYLSYLLFGKLSSLIHGSLNPANWWQFKALAGLIWKDKKGLRWRVFDANVASNVTCGSVVTSDQKPELDLSHGLKGRARATTNVTCDSDGKRSELDLSHVLKGIEMFVYVLDLTSDSWQVYYWNHQGHGCCGLQECLQLCQVASSEIHFLRRTTSG